MESAVKVRKRQKIALKTIIENGLFFKWLSYLICLDIDECQTGENNCHTGYATCSNTEGGFTCACNSGYIGDGVTCQGKIFFSRLAIHI